MGDKQVEKQGMSMPRLILRVVLFCILGVMIVVWVVDRGARAASQRDFDILSDMDAAINDNPMQPEIHERLGRGPDATTEDLGGLIEEYHYTSVVPGRTYRVLIAYANDGKGGMQYVDHFLNEIDNKVGLESQIWKNQDAAVEAGDTSGEVSQMSAPRADGGGGDGQRPSLAERFAGWDADSDDKLSGDEIPDFFRRNLTEIDSDGDGALSREELEAWFRAERAQREASARAAEGAPSDDDNSNGRTDRPQRIESDDSDASQADDTNQTPATNQGQETGGTE